MNNRREIIAHILLFIVNCRRNTRHIVKAIINFYPVRIIRILIRRILYLLCAPLRYVLARAVFFLEKHPRLRYKVVISTYSIIPRLYAYIHRELYAGFAMLTTGAQSVLSGQIVDVDQVIIGEETDLSVLPLPTGKRTLYIYVDHTVSCHTNTGVQRVTRGLATSLTQLGEQVRYVKWDNFNNQCVLISLPEREHLAQWNGPRINDEEKEIYQLFSMQHVPVASHVSGENHWLIVPEVTHINDYKRSLMADIALWAHQAGLKLGVVFYDTIPLRRKEFKKMAILHTDYMRELLLADEVWAISSWSANDLLSYWHTNENADKATIPELPVISLPGESQHCERINIQLPDDPVIFCVGTIEPRKNQVMLIRAFTEYKQKNPESPWQLILVGNLHLSVAKEVRRAIKKEKSILHLGHVSDDELDTLYRKSAFTAFPSIEEGFGLPILESLWHGKPCICANFGSMREVGEGGGCLMINTQDATALSNAITSMIVDKNMRDNLTKEAIARPMETWIDYASKIKKRIDRENCMIDKIQHIYYWIDATLNFPKNTGIQRVTRLLARGLLEQGFSLIPVKWDTENSKLISVNETELEYFSRWNGPSPPMWTDWLEPDSENKTTWFFMAELPLQISNVQQSKLLEYIHGIGMKSVAVFYDAIPWKMRSIYPKHFSQAHFDYMKNLSNFNLVLPISQYSRNDLIGFLGTFLPKPQYLEQRIKTVLLPGEFIEHERVTTFNGFVEEKPLIILCVGTVEPRKNHELLIKSFAQAAEKSAKPLQLIIIGGSHSALEIRVHKLLENYPNVIWEEFADDARLHKLYIECDITVFPSLEEGFGLPILESLWYGKPCICANFGAMKEAANGGGCLMVDVRDSDKVAVAIQTLAENHEMRETLVNEALNRRFKTWQEYALEVAIHLTRNTPTVRTKELTLTRSEIRERSQAMHLVPRPMLSICISTYNRAEWLAVNLKNWAHLYPSPLPDVELLVCDNASTDHTSKIIKPYLKRTDFTYHCNSHNVGMLGNLRKTTHFAQGKYVWIIGDDDLLMPGAIEKVVSNIKSYPDVALLYLNYAFTKIEDARTINNFDVFFREATPIVPAEPDRFGPLNEICARNENFFTAIYTLVFRRNHALKAYSQDTSGRPFSTMLTCIPTTYYVLNHLMNAPGVWIGTPQIVVNMNVSWLKYAPLWILERIPEVYELAEQNGVPVEDIDRWRKHTLPGVSKYFYEIFSNDPLNNARYFSAARLVRRFKHLPEFVKLRPVLRDVYKLAYENKHPAAKLPVSQVFPETVKL